MQENKMLKELNFKEHAKLIVIKSDGEKVNFHAYKISLILQKLIPSEKKKFIFSDILSSLKGKSIVKTSYIRKLIYLEFEKYNLFQAKNKYQIYRRNDIEKFRKAANPQTKLQELFAEDEKIVHENANKDSKAFNTQRDLTAGMVGKSIGLTMMPETVAKAHLRGDIHYHDLDYSPLTSMTNCCLIDFDEMFKKPFNIGNTQMFPPKGIQEATQDVVQIFASVASNQYGGASGNRIDQVLAPYAIKDYQRYLQEAKKWVLAKKQERYAKEKTKDTIYKALKNLEYGINTINSVQGQTPFTTVNFGLGTSWIEREIQKDILKIRIKGLGEKHRTAIFPKLIFTLKKGLNLKPQDPNYYIKQLAIECSTKRMYPDLLMYDKIIEITGSFKTPMGCRSFPQGWKNRNGKEINSGRMNLGVVTINLPRIALEAQGDKNLFWEIFNERCQISKKGLLNKINRIKQAKPQNAPILYQSGAFGKRLKDNESVDQLFNHSRATVSLGYIGLYEVGAIFYGPQWEHNQIAHHFTVEIVKKLHDYCLKWEKEFGYHFSLYSTPAESLTDTFCRLDTKRFGKIKNITDKGYYTNSFHYDVRKNPTPFEKLNFEKDYPYYAAGGFIHYCEYPNIKQNPKALEAVWDWAYDKVGYLGTNASIDHCYKCGFDGDFKATATGYKCPVCGNQDPNTCDVVKRLCGYLGNPMKRPSVHGRHKEISSRVKNMKLGQI